MPTWLIGKTGVSFFDVWSIVHFCFWVFVGSVAWATKPSRPIAMASCLIIAYSWEVFERYAEKKWPQYWLNPESPVNSWVSDPLMCLLGVLFVWYALDNWRS